MTYDWQIQTGDNVKVFMTGDECYFFYGTVRHYPQATGEAWIIEDNTGCVIYVQTYAKIVRLQKAVKP